MFGASCGNNRLCATPFEDNFRSLRPESCGENLQQISGSVNGTFQSIVQRYFEYLNLKKMNRNTNLPRNVLATVDLGHMDTSCVNVRGTHPLGKNYEVAVALCKISKTQI